VQEYGLADYGIHKTNALFQPLYFDLDGNETTDAALTGVPVILPVDPQDIADATLPPGAQAVYLDPAGNRVFGATNPDSSARPRAFATTFELGVPLYLLNGVRQTAVTPDPAVLKTNRVRVVPWTRNEDVVRTVADDASLAGIDTLVVDNAADMGATGNAVAQTALVDSFDISVDRLASGQPLFHNGASGTVVDGAFVVTSALSPTAKSHAGGEPVLDPFTHMPLFYRGGEPMRDLLTRAPLYDPFGNPLFHKDGDPMLHFRGDAVVQRTGEIQRYLGGELVFDEMGNLVPNPVKAKGNPTLVFDVRAGLPDTITRTDTRSWIVDGFAAGNTIRVTGAGSNNGLYTIASIDATEKVLTLLATDPARPGSTIAVCRSWTSSRPTVPV
jgi:hypothetical protein